MSFSKTQYVAVYLPFKGGVGKAFATKPQESAHFPATVTLDGNKYIRDRKFVVNTKSSIDLMLKYCKEKNIQPDVELPS